MVFLPLWLAACTTAPQRTPAAIPTGGRGNEMVGETVADRPSPHYRFERHFLDSVDGLRHYRIDLAIPRAPAPDAGYPVLYLLDGNAALATLTDADLVALADKNTPLLLVAVGYDVPTRNDVTARAYDYTPPLLHAGAPSVARPVVRGRMGGGAQVFLQFIASRIKPLVRARVATDTRRECLWGHSYGGLFALYAFFAQPQEFFRYVAGDPSFWWHDGEILQHWRRFNKKGAAGKQLAILIGTKARARAAASGPADTDAVDRLAVAREITNALRAHDARTRLEIFPQYGHGEMIRTSLEYALFSGC